MLPSEETIQREMCRRDAEQFLRQCHIKEGQTGEWLPFHPWEAQRTVLRMLRENRRLSILKARQLGMTWLVLAHALWLLLFQKATVLVFSRTDVEAKDLAERMTEMHRRLPPWLRQKAVVESKHELLLDGGGRALSFPTTGGRGYTATLAIVDEADFVPDLAALLGAVEPTVGDGGQLVLISSANKSCPQSLFKKIYLAAKRGENGYAPVFFGWATRPGRTQEWYDAERRKWLSQEGSDDHVHQEYPATDVEALSPRTLDKRIAPAWLRQCYHEQAPDEQPVGAPAIPGLEVYALPEPHALYVIGADPAEGNPTSDDSALTVLRADTAEEVAALAGRIQPSVFADYIDQIGRWYNQAPAMVERNNHGHAVLLWLGEWGGLPILLGHDGHRGWMSSVRGKALLYNACADLFRAGETRLHSLATFTQLASIEGSTLRAPEGEHDDRADAYALACAALASARGRLDEVPEPLILEA